MATNQLYNSCEGCTYLNMILCCPAVGINNFQNQSEKYSMASNDSPIYSTINTAAEEDLLAYMYSNAPYTPGPDPYAGTPVLSNNGLVGLEEDLDQWTLQSGQAVSDCAMLQYARTANGKGFLHIINCYYIFYYLFFILILI